MRLLTSIFGGPGFDALASRGRRHDQELPGSELYKLLWAYYLGNGLYDELRLMGFYLENQRLKELRNPAGRAVEFFVDTIWPGTLPKAIPIIEPANDAIIPAIEQVWSWSNWQARKQVAIRWAGITGNVYLRVARPLPKMGGAEAPKRVYIQLIRPEYVTEREVDERDYIIFARLDIPMEAGRGRKREQYTHTEVWTPEAMRIWYHKHGADRYWEDLGQPDYEVPLSEWGLDFIPIVHAKHMDIGEDEGVGAFTLSLSKINEVNRMATRLHQILYRHNDVTWALQANAMDPSGRPIPAPRIEGTSSSSDGLDGTVELGGERILRLPGQSTLSPLIPDLNYGSHLDTVVDMLGEIERDMPQLVYYKLKDLPEMSGKALRLLLTPALATAAEVRGNMEGALIRAHKMALTIGKEIGAFEGDIGSYENGDYDHQIAERPLIGYNREEIAELAGLETAAGIPLITSLRKSGWTEEDLEQMEDDKESEQSGQQMTLAGALMTAQDQLEAGQQSNGLEGTGQPPRSDPNALF